MGRPCNFLAFMLEMGQATPKGATPPSGVATLQFPYLFCFFFFFFFKKKILLCF
jgi:hypothetical protein